jgi:hypothetical protein
MDDKTNQRKKIIVVNDSWPCTDDSLFDIRPASVNSDM